MTRTWKPTVAGVLSIITGAFTTYYRTSGIFVNHWHPITLILSAVGVVAVVGGIFAVKRQRWGLALAGAICTVYPPHPWGDLAWTPLLGVLAIVLLVLSKKEFSS